MEILHTLIQNISDFLWGGTWGNIRLLPFGLLSALLLGSGLYMTMRLKALPLKRIVPAIIAAWNGRNPQKNAKGDISPWQALSTALAGQIGTGNLAGVATAITLGGPGAIFWMWITALLGMALAFAESSLAVKFRQTNLKGQTFGGPMYYMQYGLKQKWRWIAIPFCIGTIFSATATGGMIQSNSLTKSIQQASTSFAHYMPCQLTQPAHENWRLQLDNGKSRPLSGCEAITGAPDGTTSHPPQKLPAISQTLHPALIGALIAILVFAVIIGGIKSIGRIAGYLVPFMALLYVSVSLIVLIMHAAEIPRAIMLILQNAFGIDQATGGFAGGTLAIAIRAGVARGLFSNEAGQGSAPIAHATAKTLSPAQQGEIAMIGVFIDTIIICTMTALVILCIPGNFTDYAGNPAQYAWQDGNLQASAITTSAYEAAFTGGKWIVVLSLLLFSFTTIIGWTYYAEQALSYLTNGRGILAFRYIWILLIFCGSMQETGFIWKLGDLANASMILPNLIAILALSGTVAKLAKNSTTT